MTLSLDEASFTRLQAWRVRHFPPARNFIPAHLTLFHTLSARQVAELNGWAHSRQSPVTLTFARPRFLGHGIAIEVESAELESLRERVARIMGGALTRQDQAPFRPHVTIQNKAHAAEAKALHETFTASFEPWSGQGLALLIWQYLAGPWSKVAEYPFNRVMTGSKMA